MHYLKSGIRESGFVTIFLKKYMQLKEVNHLISTDQIEMEYSEATDKPNNNGSIYD